MFEYIKGTLVQIELLKAVVEVNGIAYKLLVPINSSSKISKGKEILFYTSLVIREDRHTLYGFLTQKERDLFEILTSVSGIGPKTALALIGHLSWEQFTQAIANKEIPLISKVPGIGKKTAERLLIEMKDKIHSLEKNIISTDPSYTTPAKQQVDDAISALINLGYNPIRAKQAIQESYEKNNESDASTLISNALSKI
jgi:Holliday junction DNA helicase RuvA